MRLLVDVQAVLWAVDDPAKLTPQALVALQDPTNELLLSAGTIWELAIKIGLGKLKLSLPFKQWMAQAITDLALTVLPITVEYADRQSVLLLHHRDPFDRLLIAQAQVENVPIVSADPVFDRYGVNRIW
jgi:PIN domain nuclease of toxin-antitoxin system